VVLNNAQIGHGSIIGANALVPQNTVIPPFSLVLGTPAKVVKTLEPQTLERIQSNVDEYVQRAQSYREHYAQKTQ
jgi:carbonic anhydrase/acetyltransferase-like protein (isoleucine patch superfamily)